MKKILKLIYLKKFYLIFVSGVLVLVGLGCAIWALMTRQLEVQVPVVTKPTEVKQETAVRNQNETEYTLETLLIVDIGGAVWKPGVYALADGSKLADLVQKAGGLREDVLDLHLVQKELNLAESLKDGQKYYIPYKGESWSVTTTKASATTTNEAITNNGLISINSADLKTLQTLTGIGAVRAQAIIDGRPYTELKDLVSKSVLTQNQFDKIEEAITL